MFLKKYLNETYYNLLINTYDEEYLNNLDEKNFLKIYKILKLNKVYFIEDIILKYLEIFTLDELDVEKGLVNLKAKLGDNYIYLIGNNLTFLKEIIENANK